jgi:hypothetical protein
MLLLLLKQCLCSCQGLHDWQQALQMLLQQLGVSTCNHTFTVGLATVSAPIKWEGLGVD